MTNYKLLVPFILGFEGHIADDPNDNGGLTNKGVTYSTYNSLCEIIFHVQPSKAHFLNLTDDETGLFIKYFWDKSTFKGAISSQKVSEAITTWMWGSGKTGLERFQQMLNEKHGCNLEDDGVIGENTVRCINSIDENQLFYDAVYTRKQTFENICKKNPSQLKFLKGWTRRLKSFAKKNGLIVYF